MNHARLAPRFCAFVLDSEGIANLGLTGIRFRVLAPNICSYQAGDLRDGDPAGDFGCRSCEHSNRLNISSAHNSERGRSPEVLLSLSSASEIGPIYHYPCPGPWTECPWQGLVPTWEVLWERQ